MTVPQRRDQRPGFAFLLPWSFDFEGGGVGHAVVGLSDQCREESIYRPLAFESDWDAKHPEQDEWRGMTRIRLRLRAPWDEKQPLRVMISYLLHLPADLYRWLKLINTYNVKVINRQFPGLDCFNFVLMRSLGLFRGKNVLTFQGTDVRLVLSSRGMVRRLLRWMLFRADLLVFVSHGLKEEFLAFDSRLANRCVVIHNGVDVQSFKTRSREELPDTELFNSAHDVVLSIGRFEHRKGHDLLVRAFELVLRQQKTARLAIIGRSGPTFDDTQKLIKALGLDDYVALLTDIPYQQIPAFIQRSGVFVLCSRWEKGKFGEGFPLALAESGALARPVVSTQSTGCDEIIRDGETGRLVAVDDPQALASAIIDVLKNRNDAERMAFNLHNLVCNEFTWQRAWHKYRRFVEA